MVSEEFRKNVNTATDFIESCFDENNNDNLSFDERVAARIGELPPAVAEIVKNSMDWEATP